MSVSGPSSSSLLPAFDPVGEAHPYTSGYGSGRSVSPSPSTARSLSSSDESSSSTPTASTMFTSTHHIVRPPPSLNRTRSSSLAAGSSMPTSRSNTPVPMPPLPYTPEAVQSFDSGAQYAQVTPRVSIDMHRSTSEDWLQPPIHSVSVPNFSKQGKHCAYACRVNPVPASLAITSPPNARAQPLFTSGKMTMATASEPHTVHRRWSEFVDFSSRLAIAFPYAFSPSSSTPLPQLPSKKTGFFARALTPEERLLELESFTRRLFNLPDEIKNSVLVREFFRIRQSDSHGRLTSTSQQSSVASSPASSSGAVPRNPVRSDSPWGDNPNDGGDSFAHFLAANISPNSTVRPVFPGKIKARPALTLQTSRPNLRMVASSVQLRGDSELIRPHLAPRAATTNEADSESSRGSLYAASTTSTITPANASSASRFPSPLATTAKTSPPPPPVPQKDTIIVNKKKGGLLRSFRSLGDLRASGNNQAPAVPTQPLPQLSAASMLRAVTQPNSRIPPLLATNSGSQSGFAFPNTGRSVSTGQTALPALSASSTSMSRHRPSNSGSSSTSSIEDPWAGPPAQAQPLAHPSAAFRRHPSSGRVEVIPLADRPRRPSMPTRGTGSGSGSNRTQLGHNSQSPSLSSLDSMRSSRSSDMSRSMSERDDRWTRRSSTEYSYSDISTPPTPQSEFGAYQHNPKYELEQALSNKVPLPPFFPVPPSSSSVRMEAAYSQDGLPHLPMSGPRRPSLDLRPRATSSSSSISRRSPLDTILASPKAGTTPSSTSSSPSVRSVSSLSGLAPQDRPYVNFKLLHPKTNLVLRVNRNELNHATLLQQVQMKFSQAGVELEGDWGLLFSEKADGAPRSSRNGTIGTAAKSHPIISDDELTWVLRRAASAEKITLRVLA